MTTRKTYPLDPSGDFTIPYDDQGFSYDLPCSRRGHHATMRPGGLEIGQNDGGRSQSLKPKSWLIFQLVSTCVSSDRSWATERGTTSPHSEANTKYRFRFIEAQCQCMQATGTVYKCTQVKHSPTHSVERSGEREEDGSA